MSTALLIATATVVALILGTFVMLVGFECMHQYWCKRSAKARAAENTRMYRTPWRDTTHVTTSDTQARSVTTGTRAGWPWWRATPLVAVSEPPASIFTTGTNVDVSAPASAYTTMPESGAANRGIAPCRAEEARGETNDSQEDVEATGSEGRTEPEYYEFVQPWWVLAARERLGLPTHPDPLRSHPILNEHRQLEDAEDEQPWWENPNAYNSRDGSIQVNEGRLEDSATGDSPPRR